MSSWLASVRTGLISRPEYLNGYVLVECPIGECSFALCTADVFDPNTLTITVIEDGLELRTFAPGTWVNASVYDSRGNLLFALYAGQPAESRKAS